MTTKLDMSKARTLAQKTANAYSFNRYRSWPLVIKRLADRGYNEREIEAIVRSKWMRWAADETKGNGKASSADLIRWLDRNFENLAAERREVKDLIETTFGGVSELRAALENLIEKFSAEQVGAEIKAWAEENKSRWPLTDNEAKALAEAAEADAEESLDAAEMHDLRIATEFPWETKERAGNLAEQLGIE